MRKMTNPSYQAVPPRQLLPRPESREQPAGALFWSLFSMFGTFLIGISLFWWGSNILIYDWAGVRETSGIIAYLLIAPLTMGATLSWLSMINIFSFIQNFTN